VLAGALLFTAALTTVSQSPLRLGANVEQVAKDFESKWTPKPDTDRPKYVPYTKFHFSWGGGRLEADTAFCFPRGRVWATHYDSCSYAQDGTITNISSYWSYNWR
jgi:hypothetical protein